MVSTVNEMFLFLTRFDRMLEEREHKFVATQTAATYGNSGSVFGTRYADLRKQDLSHGKAYEWANIRKTIDGVRG